MTKFYMTLIYFLVLFLGMIYKYTRLLPFDILYPKQRIVFLALFFQM